MKRKEKGEEAVVSCTIQHNMQLLRKYGKEIRIGASGKRTKRKATYLLTPSLTFPTYLPTYLPTLSLTYPFPKFILLLQDRGIVVVYIVLTR